MPKYCVTYESDIPGKETQVFSTDLSFQEASELSVALQADAFLEDSHNLRDGQYAVQPQLAGVNYGE